MQTRHGRDLLQIATGRFREAGESTVTKDTVGGATHSGNCEAVGARAHTFGRCRPVVDRPNRVNLRDTRAAPTYSTPAHASRRHQSAHPAAGCRYQPNTRMQRSRRDESDGDDRFAAPKLRGFQGVCPSNKRLFVMPPGGWHACARITRCNTCVRGGMAVAMGMDDVDHASPTGVRRRSFGALAPHTDESTTVVGIARVAGDGAQ